MVEQKSEAGDRVSWNSEAGRGVPKVVVSILVGVLAPALYTLGRLPVVFCGDFSKDGLALTGPLPKELAGRLSHALAPFPVLDASLGDRSQRIGATALESEDANQ